MVNISGWEGVTLLYGHTEYHRSTQLADSRYKNIIIIIYTLTKPLTERGLWHHYRSVCGAPVVLVPSPWWPAAVLRVFLVSGASSFATADS